MALWVVSKLLSLLPERKLDDLKLSEKIVQPLALPDSTKQFVFALRVSDESVVYLLAAEKLSENSANDARALIGAVQPKVVVAQIDRSSMDEIKEEESNLCFDEGSFVPTSWLGVLKGCFLEKINWKKYESRAGSQMLKTIFGTGFYGHIFAARQAAEETESAFLFLESPSKVSDNDGTDGKQVSDDGAINKIARFPLREIYHVNSLVERNNAFAPSMLNQRAHMKPLRSSSAAAFSLRNSLLDQSSNSVSSSVAESDHGENEAIPSYAVSFYPLLEDLYAIFSGIPDLKTSLPFARKMLTDIEHGKEVDNEILSEVSKFRLAVEGLRFALNLMSRVPLQKQEKNVEDLDFSDLSQEEKCDILIAQSLKQQAKKSGTLVAVVNASSIAGIRKYWNASLPSEVANTIEDCFLSDEDNEGKQTGRKMLAGKPVVAVGAGAATVVGVSSFTKIVPASSIVKAATINVPNIMKFSLLQSQRVAALAMGKILGPMKVFVPAYKTVIPGKMAAGYAVQPTASIKAIVGAEKLRAVSHTIVVTAQNSSLSAIRTAFYGIMRNRVGRRTGPAPWMSLGCSIAACSGLVMFGDGIECAAESAPAIPSIARIGQGLEKLRVASQNFANIDNGKVWESIKNALSISNSRR